MAQTIFMQTTEVPAERSAAEITSLLVQAGARQIASDYSPQGRIVGIRFTISVNGREFAFDLPARTDPVFQILMKRKPFLNARFRGTSEEYSQKLKADAERIGWRQLYRWVQAQLAMIDAGMVSTHEVFLPYMVVGGGTVLQMFEEQNFKMLTAGTDEKIS